MKTGVETLDEKSRGWPDYAENELAGLCRNRSTLTGLNMPKSDWPDCGER